MSELPPFLLLRLLGTKMLTGSPMYVNSSEVAGFSMVIGQEPGHFYLELCCYYSNHQPVVAI